MIFSCCFDAIGFLKTSFVDLSVGLGNYVCVCQTSTRILHLFICVLRASEKGEALVRISYGRFSTKVNDFDCCETHPISIPTTCSTSAAIAICKF